MSNLRTILVFLPNVQKWVIVSHYGSPTQIWQILWEICRQKSICSYTLVTTLEQMRRQWWRNEMLITCTAGVYAQMWRADGKTCPFCRQGLLVADTAWRYTPTEAVKQTAWGSSSPPPQTTLISSPLTLPSFIIISIISRSRSSGMRYLMRRAAFVSTRWLCRAETSSLPARKRETEIVDRPSRPEVLRRQLEVAVAGGRGWRRLCRTWTSSEDRRTCRRMGAPLTITATQKQLPTQGT